MIGKTIKIGTGVVAVLAASLTVFPTSAFADYGPSKNDVVGVGSDTLQQLGDFVADGDFVGDNGYNFAGNKNKFISVDATADANTRLAYSTAGLGTLQTIPSGGGAGTPVLCAPGTGSTTGTGNANNTHADTPCTLNPTVVLRAGKAPTQRPNGSGAGFNLLKADTNASGVGLGYVDFSRASSPRGTNALFDSIQVGSDPLAILSSSTTHAVALTANQLLGIYQCSAGSTDWSSFGGTAGTIRPLLPQIGSGTRDSFLKAINGGATFTPGNCVTNVEENDPEAIDASGDPINAIEPMSYGRLQLFLGNLSTGVSNGVGGYFHDPSCPFPPSETASTVTGCTTAASTLSPNVKFWDNVSNPSTTFDVSRPLYIYFRHADIDSTKKFQPGGALNWVRTMLYNPCSGTQVPDPTQCVTIGGVQYGPGGQPYFATGAAQSLISAAGITPAYAYTASGP